MDEEQPVADPVEAQEEVEPVAQPDAEPVEEEVEVAQEEEVEAEAVPDPQPEVEEEPDQKVADPEPVAVDAFNGDLPASIADACDILYSDNPAFNWMVTNLTDAKKGKDGLVMEQVGTGGLNELKDFVKDKKSNIMFFLLRVNTYDDEGSSRAKFIYGRFMGTGVKFMQKAKLTPKLGEIADEFQVKHLSRDADEEMKDWDPETLGKEFLRIGGAHKPSKYDFGPNAVYNCK